MALGFWQWAHYVDVCVVETSWGRLKPLKGCFHMCVDLGLLTVQALTGPLCDLFVEAVPYELCGN